METKELAIVQEKLKGMSKMVLETTVTTPEELAEVSNKIKNVKQLGKYIKEVKDKLTEPAKAIIDQAKVLYDIPLKECVNAELALKRKAEIYLEAEEAKRKEAEKKIVDKVETGYIKPETAVNKLEALGDVQKKVVTTESTLSMTKRKVPEIVDPSLVPDEYWEINEVKVRRDALGYKDPQTGQQIAPKEIPGVIIKEVSSINSR